MNAGFQWISLELELYVGESLSMWVLDCHMIFRKGKKYIGTFVLSMLMVKRVKESVFSIRKEENIKR